MRRAGGADLCGTESLADVANGGGGGRGADAAAAGRGLGADEASVESAG